MPCLCCLSHLILIIHARAKLSFPFSDKKIEAQRYYIGFSDPQLVSDIGHVHTLITHWDDSFHCNKCEQMTAQRPNPAPTRFSIPCELRMVFTFLNGWEKNQRRRIFYDVGKLCEVHISVSIDNIFLWPSHAHLSVLLTAAFALVRWACV